MQEKLRLIQENKMVKELDNKYQETSLDDNELEEDIEEDTEEDTEDVIEEDTKETKKSTLTFFIIFFPSIILSIIPSQINGSSIISFGIKSCILLLQLVILKNFVDTFYE